MSFVHEANHSMEFLVSEANHYRSRENGTLKAGEVTVPGSILVWSGDELAVSAGTLDTGDDFDENIAGIAGYAVDATDGARPIMYIARDAEVSEAMLAYPAETSPGGEKAAVIVALKTLNIFVRDGTTVPTA